ncbi:MAG TPA: DUF2332 family protein [Microbacterium sp.]|nr:DUF2332 family protein [Microbacterium sp.]
MDAAAEVADRYRRFARDEAPGRSDLYAEWAAGVAADRAMTAILGRIPETHRQPPLVFAVTRMLGAPERPYPEWADWVAAHADEVVAECSARSLQTNEPLRCAALVPALSGVDGPIALLEVGASAGLCLYPDRYSYRYGGGEDLDPREGTSTVVLHSAVIGVPPLRMPDVVWRAGIDLAPLDAADADDRRFLLSLVWPGEDGRAARIDAALDIAAADPPLLVRGDAAERGALAELAALAPRNATLVITTPGVLPHIARAGRARLGESIASLDAVWISIDPPGLHVQGAAPVDPATWGGFVLRRDGVPLAAVDPLGAFVEWRGGRANDAR